jgi:hypothetical protein
MTEDGEREAVGAKKGFLKRKAPLSIDSVRNGNDGSSRAVIAATAVASASAHAANLDCQSRGAACMAKQGMTKQETTKPGKVSLRLLKELERD